MGNVIFARDTRIESSNCTYGFWVWGSDERIRNNVVYTPVSRKVVGIVVRGNDALVTENTAVAMELVDNGYGSDQRGVGIGIGNTSRGSRARGNSTSGFDVGIGPAQAHQSPPWYLDSHFSGADVLAVDARGVISE
jgi:hypothetical protein